MINSKWAASPHLHYKGMELVGNHWRTERSSRPGTVPCASVRSEVEICWNSSAFEGRKKCLWEQSNPWLPSPVPVKEGSLVVGPNAADMLSSKGQRASNMNWDTCIPYLYLGSSPDSMIVLRFLVDKEHERQQWWLKWLAHCHLHGKRVWHTWFLL